MTWFQRIRQTWGGGDAAAEEPPTPKSPRQNPWREVFDPNSNPNLKKAGRSYYDTVDKDKKEPSCWDYVAQSQEKTATTVKEKAFAAMGAKGGTLDAADLRKMFEPEHVETIMKMADKNGDGKIDFNEFCEMLRKY